MPVFSGLTVNTNVSALTAQTNLQRSSGRLNISLERLSTGLKINSSADNPSGLVISEFQRAQIAGLEKAIDNVDRAISLVQTAEGGLSEINALLIEIRALAIDSANNGALDLQSLEANQSNVANLAATITRIARNTQFGTFNLLDGSSGVTAISTNTSFMTVLASTETSSVPGNNEPRSVLVATAAQRAVVSATLGGGGNNVATEFSSIQADGTVKAALGQITVLQQSETVIINGVDIFLEAGLTKEETIQRINEFTGQSGVVAFEDTAATAATAGAIGFRTVQFGAAATLNIVSDRADVRNNVGVLGPDGTHDAADGTTGVGTTSITDAGVDIAGSIDGLRTPGVADPISAVAHGNTLVAPPGTSIAGIVIEIADDTTAAGLSGAGDARSAFQTETIAVGDGVGVVLVDNSRSFQIGAFGDVDLANPQNRAAVQLDKADAEALGTGLIGNQFDNLAEIDIRNVAAANDTLLIIDAAINQIANQRGTIGAFQKNTLETTQSNLRTQLVNLQDAESVLRDTDFTTEITNFTSEQIRQQASTTVLGLANQSALAILGLLQGQG